MNFEFAYIPAILLTGVVYLSVFIGLWKNEIRKVYSRRTKREKILSVVVLAVAVVASLFIAARQGTELPVMGSYTATLHAMLLWFLNGSTEILALAVFIVCAVPVMMVSAIVIDEFGQRNTALALPFYYYVILFLVEAMFYAPLTISVSDWFVLLLFVTALYCRVKAHYEGTNKKKNLLSILLVAVTLAIFVIEQAIPAMLLVEYIVLFVANVGAAFVINRASVLKKRIWYAVTLVCFVGLFFVGRLF